MFVESVDEMVHVELVSCLFAIGEWLYDAFRFVYIKATIIALFIASYNIMSLWIATSLETCASTKT